jgi:hypothetical protein
MVIIGYNPWGVMLTSKGYFSFHLFLAYCCISPNFLILNSPVTAPIQQNVATAVAKGASQTLFSMV